MGCNADGSSEYANNIYMNNEQSICRQAGVLRKKKHPDDILMYTTTAEEHFKILGKVFICLYKQMFTAS